MDIRLNDTTFEAAPGVPLTCTVTLTNTSGRTATATMRIVGVPSDAAGFSAVRLEPGASERIDVQVTMPLGSPAGVHPFQIEVSSDDGIMRRVEASAVIREAGFMHIGLSPSGIDDYRVGRLRTTIYNHGRVPVALELSGDGDDHPMRFKFKPRRVTVMPGERVRIPTKVTSRQPFIGDPVARGFTVRAHGASIPLHARGTFRQHALVSRGATLTGSVLAVLLAFALVAVLLVIPDIRRGAADRLTGGSAQDEAVDGEDGQPGDGQPGDDGTGSGGDGADGSGTDDGSGTGGEGTDGSGSDGSGGDGAGTDGSGADGDGENATTSTVPAGVPRVTGFVRDEAGNGVSGVAIGVRPVNERTSDASIAVERAIQPLRGKRFGPLTLDPRQTVRLSGSSGSDGSYTVSPLDPGPYVATFTHPVYETTSRIVIISPDRDPVALDVPLTPAQGSLSGTVSTDPPGQVARIVVSDGTTTYETRSRPDGTWSIPRVSAGRYVATASLPTGESAAVPVAVGQGAASAPPITIASGFASITGRVCDATDGGGGIAGATVEVVILGTVDRFSVTTRDAVSPPVAVVDTQIGTFTIDGLPVQPTYTVVASADGYASTTQELRTTGNPCITMPRTTGGIIGRVAIRTPKVGADVSGCLAGRDPTDAEGGEGIQPTGIRVDLVGEGRSFSTTVGEDGVYEMSGVPAGEYTVVFSGDQAQTQTCRVTVIAPNTPRLGALLVADTRQADNATTPVRIVIDADAQLRSSGDPVGLQDLVVSIKDHVEVLDLDGNQTPPDADPVSLPVGRHTIRISATGHETIRLPFKVSSFDANGATVNVKTLVRPGTTPPELFNGELRPLATVDTEFTSAGAAFTDPAGQFAGEPAPAPFLVDTTLQKRLSDYLTPNLGLADYGPTDKDEGTTLKADDVTEVDLPRRLPSGFYHLDATSDFHYDAAREFEIDLKDLDRTDGSRQDFDDDVALDRYPRTRIRVVKANATTEIAENKDLDTVTAVYRTFETTDANVAKNLCVDAGATPSFDPHIADSLGLADALTVEYDIDDTWDGVVHAHSTDTTRRDASLTEWQGFVVVCRRGALSAVAQPITVRKNSAELVSVPIEPVTSVQLWWDDFGTRRLGPDTGPRAGFAFPDAFTVEVLVDNATRVLLDHAGGGRYETDKVTSTAGVAQIVRVVPPENSGFESPINCPDYQLPPFPPPPFPPPAPCTPLAATIGGITEVELDTKPLNLSLLVRTTSSPADFTVQLTPVPGDTPPAPPLAAIDAALQGICLPTANGVDECTYTVTAPTRGTYSLGAVSTTDPRAITAATGGDLRVNPDREDTFQPATVAKPLLVIGRKQVAVSLVDTTKPLDPFPTDAGLQVVVSQFEGGLGADVPQDKPWDAAGVTFYVDPTDLPEQIDRLTEGAGSGDPTRDRRVVAFDATAFADPPPDSGPVTVTLVDDGRECRSVVEATRRDVCEAGVFTADPRFGFLGPDVSLDAALSGPANTPVPATVQLVPYTDIDVQVFGNAGGVRTLEENASVVFTIAEPAAGFEPLGRYLTNGAWQPIPFTELVPDSGNWSATLPTHITCQPNPPCSGSATNANLVIRGLSFRRAADSCGACDTTFAYRATHPAYADDPPPSLTVTDAQGTERLVSDPANAGCTPPVTSGDTCPIRLDLENPTPVQYSAQFTAEGRPLFATYACIEFRPSGANPGGFGSVKIDFDYTGGTDATDQPVELQPRQDYDRIVTFSKCDGSGGTGRYTPPSDVSVAYTLGQGPINETIDVTPYGAEITGTVRGVYQTKSLGIGDSVRIRLYALAELDEATGNYEDLLPTEEPTDGTGDRICPIGDTEDNPLCTDVSTPPTPCPDATRPQPCSYVADDGSFAITDSPNRRVLPLDTGGTPVAQNYMLRVTSRDLVSKWHAIGKVNENAVKAIGDLRNDLRTVEVEFRTVNLNGGVVNNFSLEITRDTPQRLSSVVPDPIACEEKSGTNACAPATGNKFFLLPGDYSVAKDVNTSTAVLETTSFSLARPPIDTEVPAKVVTTVRMGFLVTINVVDDGSSNPKTPISGVRVTLGNTTAEACTTSAAGTCTVTSPAQGNRTISITSDTFGVQEVAGTGGNGPGVFEVKARTNNRLDLGVDNPTLTFALVSDADPNDDVTLQVGAVRVTCTDPQDCDVPLTGIRADAQPATSAYRAGQVAQYGGTPPLQWKTSRSFSIGPLVNRNRSVSVKSGATGIEGVEVTITEQSGPNPTTRSCTTGSAGNCTLTRVNVRNFATTAYDVAVAYDPAFTGPREYLFTPPGPLSVETSATGTGIDVVATPRSQRILLQDAGGNDVDNAFVRLSADYSCPTVTTSGECTIPKIAPGNYTATVTDPGSGNAPFTISSGAAVAVPDTQPGPHTVKVTGFLQVTNLMAGSSVSVTKGNTVVGTCPVSSTSCTIQLDAAAGASDSLKVTATFVQGGSNPNLTSTESGVKWQSSRIVAMEAYS